MTEKRSDDFGRLALHTPVMAKTSGKDPDNVQIGRRLIATREALEHPTRRGFAKVMGVDERNLEKWELGKAQVPVYFVRMLRQRFGIPYEWVYDADPDRLPHGLAKLLITKAS